MPDCNVTKYKCGIACTTGGKTAWYKDCATGNVGTGATYAAARAAAAAKKKQPCQGLTGATWTACVKGVKKTPTKVGAIPPSFGTRPKPPPKPLQFTVKGSGGAGPVPSTKTPPLKSAPITGRGGIGVGPSGTVTTPPIDLVQPVSTTITQPISEIQDTIANGGTGTLIIIGLAVVVLVMVLGR